MLGTASKLKESRTISLTGDVNGTAKFDGSQSVSILTKQNNIKVIEGNLTLQANTSSAASNKEMQLTGKLIPFPSGFNFNNTVVIAFGTINQTYYTDKGYCYGDSSGTGILSNGMVSGAVPKYVQVGPNGINISIANFSTQKPTYKYRLVLLKIS